MDRLPTRLNLSSRGLKIQSILCPLCNVAVKTTSHIFSPALYLGISCTKYIVGGNLISLLSTLMLSGLIDSQMLVYLNVRRRFWKEFVTSLGGTFGSSEISFYLVQVGREEILFLTTSFKFGELVVGELVVGELVVGDLFGELMVGELIVGDLMVGDLM
ncbi:RNA-directed DNA polymerase, eukaryota [Tanacetum coccineum]